MHFSPRLSSARFGFLWIHFANTISLCCLFYSSFMRDMCPSSRLKKRRKDQDSCTHHWCEVQANGLFMAEKKRKKGQMKMWWGPRQTIKTVDFKLPSLSFSRPSNFFLFVVSVFCDWSLSATLIKSNGVLGVHQIKDTRRGSLEPKISIFWKRGKTKNFFCNEIELKYFDFFCVNLVIRAELQ